MSVSQDATSGWYCPASSGEWTELMQGIIGQLDRSGNVITIPPSFWLMQEPSGHFADSGSGGRTSTSETGVSYGTAVTGWSRKGANCAAGTVTNSGISVPCPALNSGSTTLIQFINVVDPGKSNTHAINNIGQTSLQGLVVSNTASFIDTYTDSSGNLSYGAQFGIGPHVFATSNRLQIGVFPATLTIASEGLSPSPCTACIPQAGDTSMMLIGNGTNVALPTSASVCMYSAVFFNNFTDAQLNEIIRRLRYGGFSEASFQDGAVVSGSTLQYRGQALSIGGAGIDNASVIFGNSATTLAVLYAGNQAAQAGTIQLPQVTGGNAFFGTLGLITAIAAGSTTLSNGTLLFSNSNGISFGMSISGYATNNPGQFGGVFATITASVANSVGAISAGTRSISSGTVVWSNSNGVSFGLNASTMTASVGGALSAGTTQAAHTNTIVFSNSNGFTFGLNVNTLTVSYTQSTSPGGINAGTQTATSGTVIFSNSNGITFGMSNSSVVTASFSQTITPAVFGLGVSSGGNTAGNTATTNGTIVFAGVGGISLSQSTAAGSLATISISMTQSTNLAAIAAGTQTQTSGTILFSNSNGISFGMSNSSIITASVSLTTTPAAIAAGTQTGSTGTFVFSNSNNILFGMSNNSVVTAALSNVSFWENDVGFDALDGVATISGGINFSVQRISLDRGVSATRLDVLGNITLLGSTAGSYTLSVGLYTFLHSSASSVSSATVAISWNSGTNSTATSIYGGQSGTRWRSVSLGTWNVTPGEYLFGLLVSASGVAGSTASMTLFGASGISIAGAVGGGNYSGYFDDGVYSAGTGALPASFQLSDINQTGASALAQPYFKMIGTI